MRDERRLAAHRQPHVAGRRSASTGAPAREDRCPIVRRVYGLVTRGDSTDALHRHLVRELDLAVVDAARYRRRAGWLRCARQRDVPFAGQQSRRRIEADPAGAGQVDLAPGVKVGEVVARARSGRRAALTSGTSWIR